MLLSVYTKSTCRQADFRGMLKSVRYLFLLPTRHLAFYACINLLIAFGGCVYLCELDQSLRG